MDLRRLRAGEWIAALGGAALLASLFLPWYGEAPATAALGWTAYAPHDALAAGLTAWESLALLDVVLALVATAALLLPVVTATQRVAAVPVAMDALLTLAGLVAVVLVLIRVAALPDGADGREWGLWLALAGTLAIVAGAGIAMRDERLSAPGRVTDATGRPVDRAPEVEAIPAPRPERSP